MVRPPALGGSEQAPVGAAVPDLPGSGALHSGRPVRARRQRYPTVTLTCKLPSLARGRPGPSSDRLPDHPNRLEARPETILLGSAEALNAGVLLGSNSVP